MPNSKLCCQLLLDKLIQGNKPYKGSKEEGQAGVERGRGDCVVDTLFCISI